jgi:hypothetical protein
MQELMAAENVPRNGGSILFRACHWMTTCTKALREARAASAQLTPSRL